MRFSITLFFILIFSLSAFGQSDADFKKLFTEYVEVISGNKPALMDEVFTQKFLKEAGGEKSLLSKIKSDKDKSKVDLSKLKWRKGRSGQSYFVKLDPASTSDIVVKKENGKLKIDQTLSDSN
jgi:hypothetical protein